MGRPLSEGMGGHGPPLAAGGKVGVSGGQSLHRGPSPAPEITGVCPQSTVAPAHLSKPCPYQWWPGLPWAPTPLPLSARAVPWCTATARDASAPSHSQEGARTPLFFHSRLFFCHWQSGTSAPRRPSLEGAGGKPHMARTCPSPPQSSVPTWWHSAMSAGTGMAGPP